MREKYDDIFSHFDTIPACDGWMDGETDGRTFFDGTVHAIYSVTR